MIRPERRTIRVMLILFQTGLLLYIARAWLGTSCFPACWLLVAGWLAALSMQLSFRSARFVLRLSVLALFLFLVKQASLERETLMQLQSGPFGLREQPGIEVATARVLYAHDYNMVACRVWLDFEALHATPPRRVRTSRLLPGSCPESPMLLVSYARHDAEAIHLSGSPMRLVVTLLPGFMALLLLLSLIRFEWAGRSKRRQKANAPSNLVSSKQEVDTACEFTENETEP